MKKITKKTIILSFFCLFSIGHALADTGTYSELHFSVLKNDPVTAVQVIQQNPAAIASFDREGQTPLHLAIKRNNLLVLKAMLDKDLNVNVNIKNKDGETPLLYASKLDNINAAKLLLERDVDVYAQDSYGKDALYFSNSNENEALTKLLMEKLNKNKVNKPSDLAGLEAKQREDQINEAMKRVKVEELNNEEVQDSPPLIAVEEEQKSVPKEVEEDIETIENKQTEFKSDQNPIIENNVNISELEDKTHVLNKQLTEKENEIQKLQKQLKATQEAQMVYAFNDSKVSIPKEVLLVEPNKKPVDEIEQSAIMFNGYNEIKPDTEIKVNQIQEQQAQLPEEVKSDIIIPKNIVSQEVSPKVKVLNDIVEQEEVTQEPIIKEDTKLKKESSGHFFSNRFIVILLFVLICLFSVLFYFYNKLFDKNQEKIEVDSTESEKDKKERIRAILNKQNRFDNDR